MGDRFERDMSVLSPTLPKGSSSLYHSECWSLKEEDPVPSYKALRECRKREIMYCEEARLNIM